MQPPANWSYQTPVPFDLLTANGVPEVFTYVEPTANQATADFICEWANRYIVVQHLLGNGVYSASGPTVHPTRTDLFAKRAVINGITPLGFAGDWATYQYAKINVTYLTNPGGSIGGGNGTNAFITVSSESGGEYMTIPGRDIVWDATGEPFDLEPLSEPMQKFIPKKAHKITVHQWFSPPFTTMDGKLGKVNSGAVSWVGRTIPAECLLFESYSETFDVTFEGITPFKVEMSFIEKPLNWNKFPAQDGELYYVLPRPFESTTFVGIFP